MVMVSLFLVPSGAEAQSLGVGNRVRLRLVGERSKVVGRVIEIGRDALTLAVDYVSARRVGPCPDRLIGRCGSDRPEPDGDSLRVELGDVSAVECSVGTHRNTRAFAIGAGLLGGTIGALAAGTCRECYSEWWSLGAVVIGVPSLLAGAIVGSLVVSEDWRELSGPWSDHPAALLPPAVLPGPEGGLTLAWSVRVG
jgi:hypothetical protein